VSVDDMVRRIVSKNIDVYTAAEEILNIVKN
jgi:hypothetical protein